MAIKRVVDLNDGKQRVYLVIRAVRNDGTEFVKIWQGRSVRRVVQIAWRRIDKQTRRRRMLWSPEADAYVLANYTSMPKRALATIMCKKFNRPFTKNSVISRHYNLKGKYHARRSPA